MCKMWMAKKELENEYLENNINIIYSIFYFVLVSSFICGDFSFQPFPFLYDADDCWFGLAICLTFNLVTRQTNNTTVISFECNDSKFIQFNKMCRAFTC